MSYFAYLPLPQNRIASHLLNRIDFLIDKAAVRALPPELFRLSPCQSAASTGWSSPCRASSPVGLVIIHCSFLLLRRVPTAGPGWPSWPADCGARTTGTALLPEGDSVPGVDKAKHTVTFSAPPGVGRFVVTTEGLTPALPQPPQCLVLFTRRPLAN